MITLWDLGWNQRFAEEFRRFKEAGLVPARAVEELKDAFRIRGESGEFLAHVAGRMRFAAKDGDAFPAVGDWVGAQLNAGGATIHGVVPRQSKVSRKVAGRTVREQVLAANLDTILVVTSLNRDLNARRIERYLVMVWESGARPVVLLNKADLCAQVEEFVREVEAVAIGVPVHVLSAATGEGVASLSSYFGRGQTVALVGSSGVGKSTIINRLLGRELLPTRAVRESDDRGRHATTSCQLLFLPGRDGTTTGGMIIDTPGLRELQLWDSGGLGRTFEDVEALAASCKFRDCRHHAEPGCAVRTAIEAGELDGKRLENFDKLSRERDFLVRKQDVALQSAAEGKWRLIHKQQRQQKRWRERHGK